jgi:hypothetical protein
MSVHAQPDAVPAAGPEPAFVITGAAHVAFAAAPTMLFSARVSDESGLEIQSIALTAQVMIDPARRGYDPETKARLTELFGPPAGWAPSTSGLAWARVAVTIPSFRGATVFGIEVPCTYDLEVAAAKYFYAVRDREVPLSFHFTGTVFYRTGLADGDRLQVAPIAWSNTAQFGMPVTAWRAMIAEHYPGGGWIRVSDATLDALNDRRAQGGFPDFDTCLTHLLEGSDER